MGSERIHDTERRCINLLERIEAHLSATFEEILQARKGVFTMDENEERRLAGIERRLEAIEELIAASKAPEMEKENADTEPTA